MDGQGRVSTSRPCPSLNGSPVISARTSANTPGNGKQADPGFVAGNPRNGASKNTPGTDKQADLVLMAVIPGSGVIMIAPVSVCHQVSTIGQRSPPITLWYQSHALGLMGSPTEPSRRSEERSCLRGHWAPH